ncbi:hypothetical protein GUITHDRAFT_103460 [Guillardia theta CCMP2712]|uniref:Uncharacterized protein n=1 Tax=Guillardia theta (strain CCMP2712) TaxID=905079 RepID=L1JS22_GUITC|nr:hypothetical protein GUITHDRAFT_103460 [Guillardia theta CCMP2712]EKX50873.1 hypothetical protein GUITHDRAFT_103460 [Guillardia theta CCMP2712]|eukprot:XP_005837853.1 hypothetical protein GUITHDRAFT_103460 [Guillardia theta CCMP2712]
MHDWLAWAGEELRRMRRRGEPAAVRRRKTREERKRRIERRLRALYEELRKNVSTHGVQREVEVESIVGAVANEGLVDMLLSCEMPDEDARADEWSGAESESRILDMNIKKARDRENYLKAIEEQMRGICGKEGKVTPNHFKALLDTIMKRIDTKKDAVELPSLESLGISMPHTVFLSNGNPTGWYYMSGGLPGKLMRRTSEKTNLLYIQQVFEAEHLKEQEADGKEQKVSRWEACCIARILKDNALRYKFLSLRQFKSFIQSEEMLHCSSFARVCDRKYPRRRWDVVYSKDCQVGKVPIFLCWDSPAACLRDTEEEAEEAREQDAEKFEMQPVEVRSEDKVMNWMMEQRARALVQALERQAEVNILKAKFTFSLDSSKGMRSNLFLMDCQDVVMETDVDHGHQHIETTSPAPPLCTSRQACRGDYCDGSYPYEFAKEPDLIQRCQLGSYDNLHEAEGQKNLSSHFVSYQILAMDRKKSSMNRVYAISSKQAADLSFRNLNQLLHVKGRGRVLADGLTFWAEYQGEISTDVCLTLTSPSGTLGKIHRYSPEQGTRSGVDVTQPSIAPVLADKLRIVQTLTCFQGEEIHGDWNLSHPMLEAGQQFNPQGAAPQLLGWGLSISYRLHAECGSKKEQRSRPPSAKATSLMQPIQSSEKLIRPFSANTWKKVEHEASEAVRGRVSLTDRPNVGSFSSLGRMALIDNVPVCLHCYAVYAKIWKNNAARERAVNPFKPMESRSSRTQRMKDKVWEPWLTLSPVEEIVGNLKDLHWHQQPVYKEQQKENLVLQQSSGATEETFEREHQEMRKERANARKLRLKIQVESASRKEGGRKDRKPPYRSKIAGAGQSTSSEQRAQHKDLMEQLLQGDLTSEQAFCRLTGRALTSDLSGKQEDVEAYRGGGELSGAPATFSLLRHDSKPSEGFEEKPSGMSDEWVWNEPTAGAVGGAGGVGESRMRHLEAIHEAQGKENVRTSELIAAYHADGLRGRKLWSMKASTHSSQSGGLISVLPRAGRQGEASSSSSSAAPATFFPERIGTVAVVDGALIERKALPNSRPWK